MRFEGGNQLNGSATQGGYNAQIDGNLRVTGANWAVGAGDQTTVGSAGILTVEGGVTNSGGTIDVMKGGSLVAQSFVQTFGSTTIDGGLQTGTSSNPGTIDIEGGTFNYASSANLVGNVTYSNGATGAITGNANIDGSVTLDAGSSLSGDHNISGDLTNGGTVELGDDPGTIDVSGTYDQAGGTLIIELAGANPGEFSQLIAGGALLGGTLDLVSWNGFQPTLGEQFKILEFGTSSGAFDSIVQSGFSGGMFDVIYDPGDVTIQFDPAPSPEPSTLLLLACGCALFTFGRARIRRPRG